MKHDETADQNGNNFFTFLDDAFSFGRQTGLATSTAKPSLDTSFREWFWDLLPDYGLKAFSVYFGALDLVFLRGGLHLI